MRRDEFGGQVEDCGIVEQGLRRHSQIPYSSTPIRNELELGWLSNEAITIYITLIMNLKCSPECGLLSVNVPVLTNKGLMTVLRGSCGSDPKIQFVN